MLRGPFHQARPGAYFTDGDTAQQEGVHLSAAAREVYFGDVPQATEPWAAWAAGGRNSPEASSAEETPYSPMAYQEGYSTSAFPAIPFETTPTWRPPLTTTAKSFLTQEFLR